MYKQQSQGTLESPNVPLCSLFSLQLHEMSKKMCSFVWRERLRSLRHRVTRPTAVREFSRVCAAPPHTPYIARAPPLPPAAKPPPAPTRCKFTGKLYALSLNTSTCSLLHSLPVSSNLYLMCMHYEDASQEFTKFDNIYILVLLTNVYFIPT